MSCQHSCLFSARTWRLAFLLSAIYSSLCVTCPGQWLTQSINLRQGWNAVFLEVQPEPSQCDAVFNGVPIESVWAWNQRFNTVQYITDPNSLLPGSDEWLMYVPAASTNRAVMNLYRLIGGKPYLIKATSATTLVLRGPPLVRAADWLGDSFNLAGFYVSSNSPPTMLSFFGSSPAHAGQPVYRLNTTGNWAQVVSPSTTTITPGEAYWVRSSGPSTYSGFHKITFEQGRSLNYGSVLVEQTLRVRNTSSNTTAFTVKKLASGAPPGNAYPALAGEVPLAYWRQNLSSNQVGWVNLPSQLTSPGMAPGAEWAVRLAVRRADMNTFSLPVGYTNALYQSLLEVSDTLGCREIIPVSASGLQSFGSSGNVALAAGAPSAAPTPPPDPRAGLWVGSVVLSNVNQAAVSSTPVPVGAPFQFRLLVHVDAGGNARLLQKVVVAWTNGVAVTNQLGLRETATPGRAVLITDEQLLTRFSGSALRDGTVTGRRFSTAAFGFRDPLLMTRTGAFGDAGGVFNCAVALGFDDPVNPFKHRYHPDHNNLDDRYSTPLQECPNVSRQVTLLFSATDPENTTLPGWRDNQVGGIYQETITGLNKFPVQVQGIFRLLRASTVTALNDAAF